MTYREYEYSIFYISFSFRLDKKRYLFTFCFWSLLTLIIELQQEMLQIDYVSKGWAIIESIYETVASRPNVLSMVIQYVTGEVLKSMNKSPPSQA